MLQGVPAAPYTALAVGSGRPTQAVQSMSAQVAQGQKPQEAQARGTLWALAWLIFVLALATTSGSLWLSVGMKLKACPLCFYQRTFAMAILGVLGMGLLAGRRHLPALPLLGLPLAVAGCGVAAFHVYLELNGTLECPAGVLGIGTAPQQSLAAFVLLLLLVVLAAAQAHKHGAHAGLSLAGLLLGALLAVGAVASSPPLPAAPAKPYEGPPDICRVPFRPQP